MLKKNHSQVCVIEFLPVLYIIAGISMLVDMCVFAGLGQCWHFSFYVLSPQLPVPCITNEIGTWTNESIRIDI